MSWPVKERDDAGEDLSKWEADDLCATCGHSMVWGNAMGACTAVDNGTRCVCVKHASH